jgi:hypothetical protein
MFVAIGKEEQMAAVAIPTVGNAVGGAAASNERYNVWLPTSNPSGCYRSGEEGRLLTRTFPPQPNGTASNGYHYITSLPLPSLCLVLLHHLCCIDMIVPGKPFERHMHIHRVVLPLILQ